MCLIDLEVKDLNALRQACANLGLIFCEGQKTHRWYGRWMDDYRTRDSAVAQGIDPKTFGQCEHAIKVPGADYEIGVRHDTAGKMRLCYDNWKGGMGIEAACGKGLAGLKQQYGAVVAKKWAKRHGFHAREVQTVNGLKLVCTR